MCFYLEAVAADGLVTGARIKATVKAWSHGHQQAGHFGAVTLEHTHTFMTLQQRKEEQLQCWVAVNDETFDRKQQQQQQHPPPG